MGEILRSYRSRKYWEQRTDKKSSSTYWDKDSNGNWFLHLVDFKGKDASVPIDLNIRNWNHKPPTPHSKPRVNKDGKVFSWDTSIIDVCLEMFRESPFLFSSPNHNTHIDKPYSTTYYMNIFKSRMCNQGNGSEGWERFDVKNSHDLRSYFITYQINNNVPMEDLAQITRHNPTTLWKYYLRHSEQAQIQRQEMIDKDRKIISKVKLSKLQDKNRNTPNN
jgi:hypothetical protein